MWLAGFGSGGTGLRRLGYVVDGLLAYVLLSGLLLIRGMPHRTRALAVVLSAGLVMLILVYGYSVPTQFVLARMRMAMYMPLLSLGAAAWCLSGLPARVRQVAYALRPGMDRT